MNCFGKPATNKKQRKTKHMTWARIYRGIACDNVAAWQACSRTDCAMLLWLRFLYFQKGRTTPFPSRSPDASIASTAPAAPTASNSAGGPIESNGAPASSGGPNTSASASTHCRNEPVESPCHVPHLGSTKIWRAWFGIATKSRLSRRPHTWVDLGKSVYAKKCFHGRKGSFW